MTIAESISSVAVPPPSILAGVASKETMASKDGLSQGEEGGHFHGPRSEPLMSPVLVRREIPISRRAEDLIAAARHACAEIVSGRDDRLIVVVGPCSIHSPEQALEYGRQLRAAQENFPDLLLLMRSYFEKPRTTVGWKGLINDPELDGTFKINEGMLIARRLLRDLTELGLPLAVELLDTISPQYLSDFITWGAIGARTTESQLHRELASGSSHPVGFKNGTDGGINVAIDAMKSATAPHCFIGVDERGVASIIKTEGNPSVHVILRGGKAGPNYAKKFVAEAVEILRKQRPHQHPSIMIDCSHGNSQKDHRNQPTVVDDISKQLRSGNSAITGVMIESNIHEGRQDIPAEGHTGLRYGVSVTDACIDMDSTLRVLQDLQVAVVARRLLKQQLYVQKVMYHEAENTARLDFSIEI